jgi:hypothetical protein
MAERSGPNDLADDWQEFISHDNRLTPASMGGTPPLVMPPKIGPRPIVDPAAAAAERVRQNKLPKMIPLLAVPGGTYLAAPVTGTPVVILVGGPDVGFTWSVRRLTVGPVDWGAYFAGTILTNVYTVCYRRPIQGDRSSMAAMSWTNQWPAQATWGKDEFTVAAGDNLYVEVYGLTTGAPVVSVGGQAEQTGTDLWEYRGLG